MTDRPTMDGTAVPRAAILTVGSELTTGRIADTNAQWAAAELTRAGYAVVLGLTVDDEPAAIADALSLALARADAVWITGGLGPTRDDLTAEAVAAALGRGMKEDAGTVERIRRWAAKWGRAPSADSFRMARVPEGAEALDNPVGSAPGIWIETGSRTVAILPGVPAEMKAIAAASVLPRLAARARAPAIAGWRVAGLPESEVDRRVRDLWDALPPGARFALQIDRGEVILRLLAPGLTMAGLAELDAAVRNRLGDAVYAGADETLESHLIARLASLGGTVAAAESVTGGSVLARLIAVPGASSVVRGGWVVYQNPTKADWLGVPAGVLAAHGPVSAEVTAALARAARERSEADFGVATTGWAGPDGGTASDPVGTVYAAVAAPDGEPTTERWWIRGGRETVREYAVTFALDLLRRAI